MSKTVGYYKDLIACFAFILALVLLCTVDISKQLIIVGLVACIAIDGVFTLNPSWHCTPFGNNAASFAIVAQIILTIVILYFIIV